MKRFALVGAIWIVFVGGVTGYMHLRGARRPAQAAATSMPGAATARYDLELTLTFDAQPDPFALLTSTDAPAAVTVRLNDQLVAELREGTPPGVPWIKESILGVTLGTNEALVEATPPVGAANIRHAVRVRILEDLRTIADETFWSEGGAKVIGTLRFTVADNGSEAGHDQ